LCITDEGIIISVEDEYIGRAIEFISKLINNRVLLSAYKKNSLEEIKLNKTLATKLFDLIINGMITSDVA